MDGLLVENYFTFFKVMVGLCGATCTEIAHHEKMCLTAQLLEENRELLRHASWLLVSTNNVPGMIHQKRTGQEISF